MGRDTLDYDLTDNWTVTGEADGRWIWVQHGWRWMPNKKLDKERR